MMETGFLISRRMNSEACTNTKKDDPAPHWNLVILPDVPVRFLEQLWVLTKLVFEERLP